MLKSRELIIPALDGDAEEQMPPEEEELVMAADVEPDEEKANLPDMTDGL